MTATAAFRELLSKPGIIVAPGAYDCLTAKIIEQAGFPAVYMTGAGMSVARLGYPGPGAGHYDRNDRPRRRDGGGS